MGEELKKTRRTLPHWTLPGSIYYVTFCTYQTTLSRRESQLVYDHIVAGHAKFYELIALIVLDDHVHMLLKPLEKFTLSRVLQGIKGVSAKRINEHRGRTGIVWQAESWDRIVRDADELDEKLKYMADNPVKLGLVASAQDYPFWFCNHDLI